MKKVSLLLCVTAACVLFCSCKHEEKMISEAAYNYSYAMANYNLNDAAKYATEETKTTTLVKADYLVKAVGEEYVKSDTPASIEITEIEITNDTTAVVVYHKKSPLKDFSDKLELRKRDGKWLAHRPIKELPPAATPSKPNNDIHEVDVTKLKKSQN